MNQRITPDRREISFNELWWYVLSKWRVFIVGFVIGTVIMAVVVGLVNMYSGKNVVFMTEEELKASLSATQVEEVDRTVELFKEYEAASKTHSTSYLMQLNAGMAYKYNCQFYVEAASVEDTENIMELLKARAKGAQVVSGIDALEIYGMDESDMDGIIFASYVGGVLDISVFGKKDDVKAIGDIISAELEFYSEELTELIGKYELAKLNASVSKANSQEIRELQECRKDDMKHMESVLTAKVNALSASQKSLYELRKGGDAAVADKVIINTVKKLNVVHVLIGSVIAVMIMVVVAVIRFIMGPKLRSVNEVEQVYNVEILGKIISDKNSKGLDKIFAVKRNHYSGLNNREEQVDYIANAIYNKCNLNSYTGLTLCYCGDGENDIKEKLYNALKGKGLTCDLVKDIQCNAKSHNVMVNAKNTVIISQIDVTLKKNLMEEVGLCDKLDVNLMGMLILI